jgi:hypothetical protein
MNIKKACSICVIAWAIYLINSPKELIVHEISPQVNITNIYSDTISDYPNTSFNVSIHFSEKDTEIVAAFIPFFNSTIFNISNNLFKKELNSSSLNYQIFKVLPETLLIARRDYLYIYILDKLSNQYHELVFLSREYNNISIQNQNYFVYIFGCITIFVCLFFLKN